jgi:hypothetical protein
MTIKRTPTGAHTYIIWYARAQTLPGIKLVLVTPPGFAGAEAVLNRAYQAYASYLANPFYKTDMPLRGAFDERMLHAVTARGA